MARSQPPLGDVLDRPESAQHPTTARLYAREWFWSRYEYDTYTCPDCGRSVDRVYRFEVHHIDEDPTNNAPENLLGLCRRCHIWRHRSGPTLSGLDVIEWAEQFPADTAESRGQYMVYDQEQTTEWWPSPQGGQHD